MVIVYKLEGRRPYLVLMFYGSLLMSMSFIFLNLPLNNGIIVAVIFMFVITIAEIVAMPFMNSYYISRTSDHNRGQYAGMYTMAWSAAQVIGSSVGTFIAYKFGFLNLWWMISALAIAAGFGYFWLQRKS